MVPGIVVAAFYAVPSREMGGGTVMHGHRFGNDLSKFGYVFDGLLRQVAEPIERFYDIDVE